MATIAVDFDGVIHRYHRGWGDGSIYDPPMAGAMSGLDQLLTWADRVFVMTSRDDLEGVAAWMREQFAAAAVPDIAVAVIPSYVKFWRPVVGRTIGVTNRKLPADYYIDDRAVRFEGWRSTLAWIADDELRQRVMPPPTEG